MASLSFDTHTYAKKLREAGFAEQQAEAQAEALQAVIEENLATKRDVESVRLEIEALRLEIREVDAQLTHDIELIRRDIRESEYRMPVRLGLMGAAAVAVVAALVKLL